MVQVVMKSDLSKFNSCREFAEAFRIGEKDFILASRSTYEKHLKALELPAKVVFRGDYGSGADGRHVRGHHERPAGP